MARLIVFLNRSFTFFFVALGTIHCAAAGGQTLDSDGGAKATLESGYHDAASDEQAQLQQGIDAMVNDPNTSCSTFDRCVEMTLREVQDCDAPGPAALQILSFFSLSAQEAICLAVGGKEDVFAFKPPKDGIPENTTGGAGR